MSGGIFSIGVSGLAAAEAGLLTTGHNIANVNTPGYSRQTAILGTRQAQFSGSGYFGQGVQVDTVRRIYSDFLTTQTWRAQASSSQLDTYNTQAARLANLFGDSTSGLTPALSDFFASVNAVAANPADVPARQSMISSAQGLVARFHDLSGQLEQSRDAVNQQLSSIAGSVTSVAQNIADLNRQIAAANAASGGVLPPNDLLDQRDALVTQLNQQIGANVVAQSDGSVNVFLSNGQALVVGQQATPLVAVPDPADARNLVIGLKSGTGTLIFRAQDLTGGALSGLLNYRENVLDPGENSLGRIALVMAQTLNVQHRLGIDLTGAAGGNLFDMPALPVQTALTNTGDASLSVTVPNTFNLTTSDYRLGYDGTNYRVARLSDSQTQVFASLPITIDGLQISLASGTMAAGDTFTIQPTRNAAAALGVAITNPNAIAAASPIRTAASIANAGTAQISTGSVAAAYLSTPLGSPFTLTYASGTTSLSGFPASAPITVASSGSSTTYPAGSAVPYTSGATITVNGISFVLSGAPGNGDTFTISPNANGIGDNRNVLGLSALESQNLISGTTNFAGAYGQMVGAIGDASHQAQLENDAQTALLSQAQQAQQSVSGVNLDEEAANLQRYQQQYQAAGKVIATAQTLFQTILDIAKSS